MTSSCQLELLPAFPSLCQSLPTECGRCIKAERREEAAWKCSESNPCSGLEVLGDTRCIIDISGHPLLKCEGAWQSTLQSDSGIFTILSKRCVSSRGPP